MKVVWVIPVEKTDRDLAVKHIFKCNSHRRWYLIVVWSAKNIHHSDFSVFLIFFWHFRMWWNSSKGHQIIPILIFLKQINSICGETILYSILWEQFSRRKLKEVLVWDIYGFWTHAITAMSLSIPLRTELIEVLCESPNNLNRTQEKELKEIISKNLAVVLLSVSLSFFLLFYNVGLEWASIGSRGQF